MGYHTEGSAVIGTGCACEGEDPLQCPMLPYLYMTPDYPNEHDIYQFDPAWRDLDSEEWSREDKIKSLVQRGGYTEEEAKGLLDA